jgi:ribosome assembly protein SQT1
MQKGVMISHQNVITNILQWKYHNKTVRERQKGDQTQVVLGLLPLSHIYGLIVVAQGNTYQGDGVIILPKFEIELFLQAIQNYKIQMLFLVSGTYFQTQT